MPSSVTRSNLSVSTLSANVGQPVTLTCWTFPCPRTGVGTPTGTISFLDGNTLIGSASLSNLSATFTTISLVPGNHILSAIYTDPSNRFQSSLSNGVMVTITESGIFSADELTVTITDQGVTYTMLRPNGTYAWNFAPTGTTYWMSTTGRDTNPGTLNAPFATAQHFANLANPGDLLYVLPGTYIEAPVFKRSGTSGNPIVMSCAPVAEGGGLGTVTFQLPQSVWQNGNPNGEPDDRSVIILATVNYITINGMIAQGALGQPWFTNPQPTWTPNGIFMRNGGSNNKVTNCLAFLNSHCGLKHQDNTSSSPSYGNILYHNGRGNLDHGIYTGSTNFTSQGDICFNNAGYAEQLDHYPVSAVASKVLSFNNGAGGFAIGAAGATLTSLTNYGGVRGIFFYGNASTTNNTVRDFIGWNDTYGIDVGQTGNDIDYCDVNNFTGAAVGTPNSPGSHCINFNPVWPYNGGLDPQFIDPAHGNFQLKGTSPCIGTGQGGVNIGCY